MTDSRETALLEWASTQCQTPCTQLLPVAGDASFRRYYRLPLAEQTLILMDAPPEKEPCEPFIRLARHWFEQGVAVPQVISASTELGAVLLQDFGDQQLMQGVLHLTAEQADPWYQQALKQLTEFQQQPVDTLNLPAYTEALLAQELDLFDVWLIQDLLGLDPAQTPACWPDFRAQLIDNALSQPQRPVHRDYHSRNLMLRGPDQPLGILDFQDAVIGPITYDAVSLIRDCYLSWPESWQNHWREVFRQQVAADLPTADFNRWFDWMGMQRHLKAAGIFARLWLRDGKASYLQDIPRTLDHLCCALVHYPEYQAIEIWLSQQVRPLVLAQLAKRQGEPA